MQYMVIIPTYNEAKNVEVLIPNILGLGKDYHVLVVDDNSPDGTARVVEEMQKENSRIHLIVRKSKMGLGSAYIEGFRYALKSGAEYIFEMDADHSHDYKDLPRFAEMIKEYDLVVGSRYVKGISVIDWSLTRLLVSYMGNIYARFFTRLNVFDSTSGFKCFRREVLENIELDDVHSNGYAFQIEMNFRAKRKGFRIGEIPVIFWGRYSGTSKMSWMIVFEAVFVVWRLRLEALLGKI